MIKHFTEQDQFCVRLKLVEVSCLFSSVQRFLEENCEKQNKFFSPSNVTSAVLKLCSFAK
jgi:hypothetical protein